MRDHAGDVDMNRFDTDFVGKAVERYRLRALDLRPDVEMMLHGGKERTYNLAQHVRKFRSGIFRVVDLGS
jgi:hypothetical protein